MRERAPARATDREVGVVAAVLEAGSEKGAAHGPGLSLVSEAPSGQRADKGGCYDNGTARVDPSAAVAGPLRPSGDANSRRVDVLAVIFDGCAAGGYGRGSGVSPKREITSPSHSG